MTPKLFADEDVPRLVVRQLRERGYDVTWGCEFDIGASDSHRLASAFAEGRVILTEDNDFAALVFVHGHQTCGIVRFALPGWTRERKAARILEIFDVQSGLFEGRITVIEPSGVRSQLVPTPRPTTEPKP